MAIHIGIEMSRDLRLVQGRLAPAGTLEAGGVNLLRHALGMALKITDPGHIQVLTVESDEAVLELCAEFECREGGTMQWVAQLVDAAAGATPEDAVVILRQMAPFTDIAPLAEALAALKRHRCVVSASKPPAGFWESRRRGSLEEPDPYIVRCFEVWRLGEFGKYGFGGPMSEPPSVQLAWNRLVEIDRPEDFARAAELLRQS